MASTSDPSTFASSAEIFSAKHTLPQIRSIHGALHVQVEEKANRLRSQVGGSYRELLGTADTIVRMRADNDRAQELLVRMGGRCGRGVVSAKAAGLADFAAGTRDPGLGRAARLRLLDACALVVGRILRGHGGLDERQRGERLVLTTKAWVLGRLLIKSLGEDAPADEDTARRLEAARKTTGLLRRRLLASVRKALDRIDDDDDDDDQGTRGDGTSCDTSYPAV
ncbi:hypothetical protein CDD83_8921 [Cordyceps sp. RAO-2017]|nr:hypothetical protein CDD83_8921 [Cordyceps sp. RAO-2017]